LTRARKAWLAYSMLNVDKVNGYPEPHDGAGFYEAIFGYSAALHCVALDRMGQHEPRRPVHRQRCSISRRRMGCMCRTSGCRTWAHYCWR